MKKSMSSLIQIEILVLMVYPEERCCYLHCHQFSKQNSLISAQKRVYNVTEVVQVNYSYLVEGESQ